MPPEDRKKKRVEMKDPPRKLTTVGGVEVIVKPPPPAQPEPEEPGPMAIIVPESLTDEEKRALGSALYKKHRKLVERLLVRSDVYPESRKDLAQRVLLILCKNAGDGEVPKDEEAYLREVVRKVVKNHKALKRLPVVDGLDADSVAAPREQEPERTADLADLKAKVEPHLGALPKEQAAVFRCVALYQLTLAQTAELLKRPLSTVEGQLKSATKKLRKLLGTDEQAAAEGDGEENEES